MRGWWRIPVTGVLLLLVIVVLVGVHSRRARQQEWCGLDSSTPRMAQIREVHADWTWNPPGFDCVYTDSRGHEVVRRRGSAP